MDMLLYTQHAKIKCAILRNESAHFCAFMTDRRVCAPLYIYAYVLACTRAHRLSTQRALLLLVMDGAVLLLLLSPQSRSIAAPNTITTTQQHLNPRDTTGVGGHARQRKRQSRLKGEGVRGVLRGRHTTLEAFIGLLRQQID